MLRHPEYVAPVCLIVTGLIYSGLAWLLQGESR